MTTAFLAGIVSGLPGARIRPRLMRVVAIQALLASTRRCLRLVAPPAKDRPIWSTVSRCGQAPQLSYGGP